MLELAFLVFAAGVVVALLRLGVGLLDPVMLFALPWLFSASILVFGLVDYSEPLIPASLAILAASISAFILGGLARRSRRRPSAPQRAANEPLLKLDNSFVRIAIASIAGVYVLDIARELVSVGVYRDLFDGAGYAQLRQEHWHRYLEGRKGLLELLRTASRVGAIYTVILTPYYWRVRDNRLLSMAALAWMALLIESFTEAGRFLIVFVSAATVYSTALLNESVSARRYSLRNVISSVASRRGATACVAAGLAAYVLFVWFPVARNPYLIDNIDGYLYHSSTGRLSDRAEHLTAVFGDELVYGMAFSTAYFSSALAKFTLFYDRGDVATWYYLGAYNFPVFSKVFDIALGQRMGWLEIRDRLADVSAGLGFGENPWATGVRDFLIDFGTLGSLVMLFCYGYIAESLAAAAKRQPRPALLVATSVMSITCAAFAYFSSFYIGPVFNTLMVSLALVGIRKFDSTTMPRARSTSAGLTIVGTTPSAAAIKRSKEGRHAA